MSLTPSQRAAVEREHSDICVEAGPGSGKTRVLIERFAFLVRERSIDPGRVLAFTFTEKAAAEIKRRLAKTFEAEPRLREAVERAWVATIHGFCTRLLRENSLEAGIDPEFEIIDEVETVNTLHYSVAAVLDDLCREQPRRMRALIGALSTGDDAGQRTRGLGQSVLDVYDAIRTSGAGVDALRSRTDAVSGLELYRDVVRRVREIHDQHPARTPTQRERLADVKAWLEARVSEPSAPAECIRALLAFDYGLQGQGSSPVIGAVREVRECIIAAIGALTAEHYAAERDTIIELIERLDALYRRRKNERSGLDFQDLEERAIALLASSASARERIRQQFDYILIDELQDTNPQQWRLVDLLRRASRFFAVGDINQSIYGFRHSTPDVFRSFRASCPAPDVLLENHRSRNGILNAVNSVFGGAATGVEPHQLTACRAFNSARVEPCVEIAVATAPTREEANMLEARTVAVRIRELVNSHPLDRGPARFGDIAILVRTMNAFDPIGDALEEAGVPYVIAGGRSFFESREVRDLIHWLHVLDNPLDEIALAGVMRSPLAGVSDEGIYRLKQHGDLYGALRRLDSLDTPKFSASDVDRLHYLRGQLQRVYSERDYLSPDRLLARVLDECDYWAALTPPRRANVDKFLSIARSIWSRDPGNFPNLLEQIRLQRDFSKEGEAPPGNALNAVSLMTVHKAKGLEFPIVFLPAMHAGRNNAEPLLCFSQDHGLGVKWRSPAADIAKKENVADPAHASTNCMLKQRDDDEEDRLLYVAMTRAEELLLISWSETPNSRYLGPWVKLIKDRLAVDTPSPSVPVRRVAEIAAPVSQSVGLQDPARDETIENRPSLTGQHDSVVTVTSIAQFAQCPRRYFLTRYLGWQPDYPPRDPGESRVEDDTLDTDDVLDAGELGRQVHLILAGVDVPGSSEEAQRLAAGFSTTPLGIRAAGASHSQREFDVVTAIDGIAVRGQIDLWFEEPGGIVLVDYKTDRPEGFDGARLEAYSLQLRLYAKALQAFTGQAPVEAWLHLLRSGESISIDVSQGKLGGAVEVLRELRDAQSSLGFPLREGEHCLRCPHYRGTCPAGRISSVLSPPSYAAAQLGADS